MTGMGRHRRPYFPVRAATMRMHPVLRALFFFSRLPIHRHGPTGKLQEFSPRAESAGCSIDQAVESRMSKS
jgi:hypothetical protein